MRETEREGGREEECVLGAGLGWIPALTKKKKKKRQKGLGIEDRENRREIVWGTQLTKFGKELAERGPAFDDSQSPTSIKSKFLNKYPSGFDAAYPAFSLNTNLLFYSTRVIFIFLCLCNSLCLESTFQGKLLLI
jgi:hypothetical protein